MIGQNIRKLRTEQHMTQKALADRLFVTAQAVSRWENGEVEPSLSTVTEIAKIFRVSTDELLGIAAEPQEQAKPAAETIVRTEFVYKEVPPPVLGVCETCNKPICDAQELLRENGSVICRSCRDRREARKRALRQQEGLRHRSHSFVLGGLAAIAVLIIGIIVSVEAKSAGSIVAFIVGAVAAFTLVSCCILRNNFIGEMVLTIFSWGFVRFPSLIFELDLDGIVWLLTVKLVFWVIGILLACAFGALAIALGGVMSLFVYPHAIRQNLAHPECYED